MSPLLVKLALFSNFLTRIMNRILTCFIHEVYLGILKHNLVIGVTTGCQPKHMLKPAHSKSVVVILLRRKPRSTW